MAETVEVPQSERERLYAEYEKTVAAPEESAKEPEVKTEAAPVEAEKPKEPEKTEPTAEKQEAKKEKFVPYDALHAERIKRKAEAEARKAAEERAKQLEDQIKRFSEPKNDEPITDYDAEIINIKRELPSLKAELQAFKEIEKQRQEREKNEAHEREYRKLQDNIGKTNKELQEAGYPGFSFALGRVTEILQSMKEAGREEEAFDLDNPEGWKKIYKESIFPDLRKEFEAGLRVAKDEEKKSLKSQAGLATVPGRSEPKPKSENEKTEAERNAEYIAERRARMGY